MQESRKCIPQSWVCDSEPDCGGNDHSDEDQDCVTPGDCEPLEHACDDAKKCVKFDHVCDGEADCLDGSDELNCSTFCNGTQQIFCTPEDKCLPRDKICNGEADCSDLSDEKGCSDRKPAITFCQAEDEFQCGDSSCIPDKFR